MTDMNKIFTGLEIDSPSRGRKQINATNKANAKEV